MAVRYTVAGTLRRLVGASRGEKRERAAVLHTHLLLKISDSLELIQKTYLNEVKLFISRRIKKLNVNLFERMVTLPFLLFIKPIDLSQRLTENCLHRRKRRQLIIVGGRRGGGCGSKSSLWSRSPSERVISLTKDDLSPRRNAGVPGKLLRATCLFEGATVEGTLVPARQEGLMPQRQSGHAGR